MRVYIIGAGPGDPRLLTLRGAELIAACPVVLYTGSLVPREVLAHARPDAQVIDSSGLTLDEIMAVIIEARDADRDVARVHTGDPVLFGSTAEQMRRMAELGIACEIVPGVSSFTAAAAVLGRELTLPELSQTVILTRAEGRTPMPPSERLDELARHQATLALFLSINLLGDVTRALIPSYGADCPVVVVHKATCPDQQIVRGTLADIRDKVRESGIRTQSMILVGRVLTATGFAESRLYAADFTHRFRRGTDRRAPAPAAVAPGAKRERPVARRGTVYLVGAGPGDPALVTVRARELLAAADVVAHDALVPPAILALARPGAELVPVGRRHGGGPTAYRLHPEVIARAAQGQVVVRLKAGDPMIFARGGEEAEELAAAGVPFEIVPGISAALGAAAYAGIPLTHRRHASDVTLVSGHDVDGAHASHTDWSAVARATGTLALYMAGHTLAANLARLVAGGRSPSTPAAYIAAATTPEQRVVTGTLESLAARVLDAAIDPLAPALIIVGDVVALRDRLAWFAPTPCGELADAAQVALAPTAAEPVSRAAPAKERRGLVVVYTGHGKGKTTAALGVVFRALGRGMRVAVVQFIKGKWKTGERLYAETLPELTFHVMGNGFTWNSDDLSRDRAAAQAAWATSKQLIASGANAVVVLDELTYAINYGFIELADVLGALRDRPPHVHVIATGRNAPEELRSLADLVSEMTSVKHPFERGIAAQPGLDY